MVLVGVPGAALAIATYFARRPAPKAQEYYETLIDTSWKDADRIRMDADRIRIDLEQERGRAQQLQKELNEERQRAGELVEDLQEKLKVCNERCAILKHQLAEALSDNGSLKRALVRWRGESAGGDA